MINTEPSPQADPGTSAVPDRHYRGFGEPEPEYPTGSAVVPPEQLPGHGRAVPAGERLRRAPATYVLLALNLGMYLWMITHGVSVQMPSEISLLHYGANNAELVLHGQWWRLVSATFVHVGLIHLATNMWCLWNLGLLGEPLLGSWGMIAVYLLTGTAGNLLSAATNLLFRNYWVVGAGASGAVFGIAGILIVLLSNRKLAQPRGGTSGIPLTELHHLRRSVINFAGINLIIGLLSAHQNFLPIQIDNRAHLGGFVYGLLLGVPLLSAMTRGRTRYLERQQLVFGAGLVVLVLLCRFVSRLG